MFDVQWVTRIIRPVFLTRTQIQTDMLYKFWHQVLSPVWMQENLCIFFVMSACELELKKTIYKHIFKYDEQKLRNQLQYTEIKRVFPISWQTGMVVSVTMPAAM